MSKILTKKDRPAVIDEEILIPDEEVLISKTDPKGIITYANEVFCKVAGYTEEELVGSPHNCIRHPDMPRIMFEIVWQHIKDRENVMAVVKNLAKDGRYYWVVTDFVTEVNADREVTGYTAYRRPVSDKVIEAITPLYRALTAIEAIDGMEASEKFLVEYFAKRNTNYDDMVEDIIVNNCHKAEILGFGSKPSETLKQMPKAEKKSLFDKLFGIK